MSRGIIRLVYRKVIDVTEQNAWEKYVFDATYHEFLIQVQNYNIEKKYHTFAELKNNVPNSEKLHFLVSASVINYLKQLNGKVPDLLNNLGKLFLPFSGYKFEIIDSDIGNKSKHRVVIEFLSEPVTWVDTIDNMLLIALDAGQHDNDGLLTDMLTMRPYLSIHSFKKQEKHVTKI